MSAILNYQLKVIFTLLLGAVLTACAPAGDRSRSSGLVPFTPEAARSIQQYLYLARTEPPPFTWRYRMLAADELIEAGRLHMAGQVLADVSLFELDDQNFVPWVLQSAFLHLENDEAEQALKLLYDNRIERLLPAADSARQVELYLLRARAQAMAGQSMASFSEAVRVASSVADELRNNLQLAIWEMLMNVPAEELGDFLARTDFNTSSEIIGWVELARLCKNLSMPVTQRQQRLLQWQESFSTHPANLSLLPEVRLLQVQQAIVPADIAMLLPLSGPFSEAGNTVRDGFLAAWYGAQQRGDNAIQNISFFDTSRGEIADLYKEIVASGAQLIIGPVRRENVDKLVAIKPELPVLLLNYSSEKSVPDSVTQFGLRTGDEVRQLTEMGQLRGWESAMIVRQEEDWTRKSSEEFAAAWQELGGVLVAEAVYQNESDVSRRVEQALGLRNSKRRYRELERLFNIRMQFEPRRRQDVDFIVMFSSSDAARLIRPVLSFHRAENLPVVSVSRAYDHTVDAVKNSDLDRVVFTEMPWFSENPPLRKLTSITGDEVYSRLHALGVDSWNLLPWLEALRFDGEASLAGVTGRLSMSKGTVSRRLGWATVKEGRLEIIGGSAALTYLPEIQPRIAESIAP